jgi:hypothetical protein
MPLSRQDKFEMGGGALFQTLPCLAYFHCRFTTIEARRWRWIQVSRRLEIWDVSIATGTVCVFRRISDSNPILTGQ